MELSKTISRALKPDAQAFDEIRIFTVPRFKDSELSGSEWRISANIQFMRNGNVIHEEGCRNTETAAHLLSWFYLNAQDNAKGFFAGEGEYCDQEGCAEIAKTKLEIVKSGCSYCGHDKEFHGMRKYRQFCERHKKRGDSSLDDSDSCYIPLPPTPEKD